MRDYRAVSYSQSQYSDRHDDNPSPVTRLFEIRVGIGLS